MYRNYKGEGWGLGLGHGTALLERLLWWRESQDSGPWSAVSARGSVQRPVDSQAQPQLLAVPRAAV